MAQQSLSKYYAGKFVAVVLASPPHPPSSSSPSSSSSSSSSSSAAQSQSSVEKMMLQKSATLFDKYDVGDAMRNHYIIRDCSVEELDGSTYLTFECRHCHSLHKLRWCDKPDAKKKKAATRGRTSKLNQHVVVCDGLKDDKTVKAVVRKYGDIIEMVTTFVIQALLPVSVTDDRGFEILVRKLTGGRLRPPCRTTVHDEIIRAATAVRPILLGDSLKPFTAGSFRFRLGPFLVLVLDGWCSRRLDHFSGAVAHWIDAFWRRHTAALDLRLSNGVFVAVDVACFSQ
jgi:hypothetical protein